MRAGIVVVFAHISAAIKPVLILLFPRAAGAVFAKLLNSAVYCIFVPLLKPGRVKLNPHDLRTYMK